MAACAVAALGALPATAWAGDAVNWSFDLTSSGEDVIWSSPSNVDPTAPRYDMSYQITLVEATVTWAFFTLTVDVTDQIPPDSLAGGDIYDGPLPILLINDVFTFPAPPEPPAVQASVIMLVDELGFGQLGVLDVTLGQADIDVGPPFGVVTVDIQAIRVAGNVTVDPLGPAADVDGDGLVGFPDLLLVLAAWGPCPAPPAECPTDIDGDGITGFADLLEVLSGWTG
jgi:hypothetical protein